MRRLVCAIVIAVLGTVPAAAQKGHRGAPKEQAGPEKPKIDEKAYKAALDRIPDSKQKYDPWGGVAPAAAKPAHDAKPVRTGTSSVRTNAPVLRTSIPARQ